MCIDALSELLPQQGLRRPEVQNKKCFRNYMDENLLREFYPNSTVDSERTRNTLRAAMLLSYVPQFQLLPENRGTFLRFTVPPFLREVVDPPLPEVIDLRMSELVDMSYRFKLLFNRRTFTSNEKSWFRKMWSNWMPRAAAALFDPRFLIGLHDNFKFLGDAYTESDDSEVTEFGFHSIHGFQIWILLLPSKNVEIEVALGGMEEPYENTKLLPLSLQKLLKELHELAPIPATINGAPESTITADQRAQIMGIAEEKCRWTDYTPEKCNGETYDPVSYVDFKPGDKVWQTSSGQCFGPDPEFGEFYRPFYFPNSDILQNPVNRNRLEEGCFRRSLRPDNEFPPDRRVRQRIE